MNFFDSAIEAISNEVKRLGSIYCFSKRYGVCANKISFWLKGKTKPNLQDISTLLDAMNYELCPKNNVNRVNLVKSCGDACDEAYISIPVVDDMNRIPAYGFIPESVRSGVAVVNAEYESVRNRSDLLAITVHDDSMSPTIMSGSMVLIDRSVREPDHNGEIWLCRKPDASETCLRRVAIEKSDSDIRIIFWIDTPNSKPPCTYSLLTDYDGCIGNAILGRAVWQRSRLY